MEFFGPSVDFIVKGKFNIVLNDAVFLDELTRLQPESSGDFI